MLTRLSALTALVLTLAACDQKTSPSAATTAPAALTQNAGEPAIDFLQRFIDANKAKIDKTAADWKTRLPEPPKAAFEPGKDWFWELKTNKGKIRLRLDPQVAPRHVSNTIYLTLLGFYDALPFHRVIRGFMAQGGCPLGNGNGNPGYKFGSEIAADVKHTRAGLLSAANAGEGTDGSQFFITFAPASHLDGRHTIYGSVVSGMDVVERIEALGSVGGTGQPIEVVLIEHATVTTDTRS